MIRRWISYFNSFQLFQLLRMSGFILTGIGLSKSGLPLSEISVYENFIFLASAFSFFWLSGLNTSLLSSEAPGSADRKTRLYSNTFALLFLFAVVSSLLLGILIHKQQFPTGLIPSKYLRLLPWYLLINSPGFLCEYIYLLRNRNRELILYGFILFSLQFLIVCTPVYLGYGIEFIFPGLLILASLRLLWTMMLVKRFSGFNPDLNQIKNQILIALPLIGAAMVAGSADYIDGFLVTHFFDKSMFAVYRYGAKELPVSLLLTGALSSSLIPELTRGNLNTDALDKLKNGGKKLMHLIFPISILLMVLSKYLYQILFSSSFAESPAIFNVFLLLAISRMVMPQTLLLARQNNKVIFGVALLEICVNIGCSTFFALQFGLIGIAIGTVCAFFFEKMILMMYVYFKLHIHPSRYIHIKPLITYSVLLLFAYWLGRII